MGAIYFMIYKVGAIYFMIYKVGATGRENNNIKLYDIIIYLQYII